MITINNRRTYTGEWTAEGGYATARPFPTLDKDRVSLQELKAVGHVVGGFVAMRGIENSLTITVGSVKVDGRTFKAERKDKLGHGWEPYAKRLEA